MSEETSSHHTWLKGYFRDGPFIGINYESPSIKGLTDSDGVFSYLPGESVTFSIDNLILGRAMGAESLTLADLHFQDGVLGIKELSHPETTNRARFLLSLGLENDLHSGVLVDSTVRDAIAANAGGIMFTSNVDEFENSVSVKNVFSQIGRSFRGSSEARNHVRRGQMGIRLFRDVPVPLRDGSTLSSDIFTPVVQGKYPVLLRFGIYGRAFTTGSRNTEQHLKDSEDREAMWWEDPKSREKIPSYMRYSESVVSANSFEWVPRGYVLVRVDARGIGLNEGLLDPFSKQEALDYYDAIQWASSQPWSDGNVGLYGASYSATNQWNVAALQPPALKAIAPLATDVNGYRDLAYPGGIFIKKYREFWYNKMVGAARNPMAPRKDFVGELESHPWDDQYYHGGGVLSADFSKIHIPVLTSISQTLLIHSRGGIEAFTQLPSPSKQLLIWDASYASFLYQDSLPDLQVFFDKHLKGKEPVRKPPPVRMIMRKGDGEFEWREESNWPIQGTEYKQLYLDAKGYTEFGMATANPPEETSLVEYSADVKDINKDIPMAAFETAPFEDDIELAGHFRATLWVASSSADADFWVSLRVLDGEREIYYRTREPGSTAPLTSGVLKASHRFLDPNLSTKERPWHTHKREDELLLSPNEIVKVDIELMPATGIIAKGRRLRIEITPAESAGVTPGFEREYDLSYHIGAVNRVYTGGVHPSSVSIPVVPHKRSNPH